LLSSPFHDRWIVPISTDAIFVSKNGASGWVVFAGATVAAKELVMVFVGVDVSFGDNHKIALFCSLRRAKMLCKDCFGVFSFSGALVCSCDRLAMCAAIRG